MVKYVMVISVFFLVFLWDQLMQDTELEAEAAIMQDTELEAEAATVDFRVFFI